jgi:hypothetical protein
VFGGIGPRIDCAGDTEEKERFLRWRAGASGGIKGGNVTGHAEERG